MKKFTADFSEDAEVTAYFSAPALLIFTLCSLSTLWLTSPASAQMRVGDTKNYRLRTDIDPRLADDLAWRMDALFAEYRTRLINFSPPGSSRFDVYVFNKKDDYTKLTDGKFPNSGGVFIGSRNLLAAYFEGQGRDQLRRTLQHEAFHQFAHSAISPKLPPWVNEGLAQVFEEGLWVGKRIMIGQIPPRRTRQLTHDLRDGRFVPFRDFISLTEEEWNRTFKDAPTASAQYNQAWAMCHFLVFATDDSGQPRYRQRFLGMLNAIHKGASGERAFVDNFSNNIDGFEDRFMEFTRQLQPTREATYIEYQGILADMVILLAQENRRFDEVDSLRTFLTSEGTRLRYVKGSMQWSTNTDPAAYFRDASGRLMTREQFRFVPRAGAPFPDIVCKPADNLTLRTLFHDGPGKVDHETLVEGR